MNDLYIVKVIRKVLYFYFIVVYKVGKFFGKKYDTDSSVQIIKEARSILKSGKNNESD